MPTFRRKKTPYRVVENFTVVHRDRRKMFLNQTGTILWHLLEREHTAESLTNAFTAHCNTQHLARNVIAADVADFLGSVYDAGILLKDGVEATPSPSARPAAAEKSVVMAKGSKPVIQSVQEECMTPHLTKPVRSTSDLVERLYWDKLYIYKMHMELTYRCNFRCVHCYNTTHKGAETEMTLGQWADILQQLADLGCYLLTFTGGEVFVRKDAVDILQLACDKTFSFRINTNGSLIDEKIVQRLASMRAFLQGVDISFYGADPDVHDTLSHRQGAHEKTLRAVRLLQEANIEVLAKFITMRDNFEGIPEFEANMRSMGVKYAISTESLIPRTNGNTSPLIQLLTDEQYKHLLATQDVGAGAGSSQACKPGHIRGAITPDGFVSPCEWLTDFKLGNIREKSLQEIWYGAEFAAFRKIFEQDSECPSCGLRPGCRRCPAHSYLETGNLLSCAPIQRHNAELLQASQIAHA